MYFCAMCVHVSLLGSTRSALSGIELKTKSVAHVIPSVCDIDSLVSRVKRSNSAGLPLKPFLAQ
eukprot:3274063-Pyramimonas_sp.AAC.1